VLVCITLIFLLLGTSVEWAYNLIRAPPYHASKADLWRYAVMYTYGGMYLDDDSDVKMPLDDVRF
jgi:mannosyltransferase OCH1-like enzyme